MKKVFEFIKRLGLSGWAFLALAIYFLITSGVPKFNEALLTVVFMTAFVVVNFTVLINMIRGK